MRPQRTFTRPAFRIDPLLGLVEVRPSPVLQSAMQGLEWCKTLVLMGLPLDDVPLPPTSIFAMIGRQEERILKGVERYDPAADSGYGY